MTRESVVPPPGMTAVRGFSAGILASGGRPAAATGSAGLVMYDMPLRLGAAGGRQLSGELPAIPPFPALGGCHEEARRVNYPDAGRRSRCSVAHTAI